MGGPYVKGAFLCEQVIEGKDDALSFLRVVDKVIRTATGQETPADMQPFRFRLKLVVMLVAGDTQGRHDVRVDMREPSGLSKPGPTVSVNFQHSTSGHNLILDLGLQLDKEGPYWFEVYFNSQSEPLTSTPLQVTYQRMQMPPASSLPS